MIADAIRQAQKMHRTMIEQTYDGTCSIYQMVHEKDPDTRVTKQQERQMASGILCHLSFSGTPSADAGETVTTVQQTIRLFLKYPSRDGQKAMARAEKRRFIRRIRKSFWSCGKDMHNAEMGEM